MRFRTMRHILTFKKPAAPVMDRLRGNAASGQYEFVIKIFGRIRPLRGDEVPEHDTINSTSTHKVKIRYTPLVNSSDMIFEYRGRTFKLTSPPINTGELDKELILYAEELVE